MAQWLEQTPHTEATDLNVFIQTSTPVLSSFATCFFSLLSAPFLSDYCQIKAIGANKNL